MLIGRDEQVRRLEDLLVTARGGVGRVAVLAGEAGLGKTRIALELKQRAEQHGIQVMWGSCSEAELALPFLPFLEALGNYLSTRANDQRLGTVRADLEPLFPQRPESLRLKGRSDSMRHKLRLFDAVAELVALAAEDHGCLLVLEDLHSADVSTLELLEYLARRVRTSRVLLVVTYRSDHLERGHPLLAIVGGWVRSGTATLQELPRLSPADVSDFLANSVGGPAPDFETVEVLCARSEGNPFVLEEMLSEAMDRSAGSGALALGPAQLLSTRLPQTVRDSILSRVDQLEERQRDVLRCASVLGLAFDYVTLAGAAGGDDAHVRSALRAAVRRQIVVDDPATGRLRFRHALTRDAIYEDLILPDRLRWHAAAAESLAQEPGTPAIELCHHMLAARLTVQAVPLCLLAAADAEKVHAYADAAELYARALPHLKEVRERGSVLCRLGNAYHLSGDPARGRAHLEDGVQILKASAATEEAAGGLIMLGLCLWELSAFEQSRARYMEAREMLQPLGPSRDLATACSRLAASFNLQYQADEAIEMCRQALAVAEEVEADEARVEAKGALGWALAWKGSVEEGLAALDRAYAEALDLGLMEGAADCLYGCIMVRLFAFRVREAVNHLDILRSIRTVRWFRFNQKMLEGLVLTWGLGEPGKALDALERALSDARAQGALAWAEWIEAHLGVVHSELGDFDRALRLLPRTEVGGPEQRRLETVSILRVTLDAGDLERSLRIARGAVPLSGWPVLTQGWMKDAIVATFLAAGALEEAERVGAQGPAPLPAGSERAFSLRMAGRILIARGQAGQAREPLAAAADLWALAGARHEESRTRLALAAALAADGDRAGAVRELRRALASARERGAITEERLVRDQLAELGLPVVATVEMVRDALERLHRPNALAVSPLTTLSSLRDVAGTREEALRTVLVRLVRELASSSRPREAEAGVVLDEYYVRRAATHETIAERLGLTRSTFYRRLHHGWSLMAERLGVLDDVVAEA